VKSRIRRDLNRPSTLGQLAIAGCGAVILGLCGVVGLGSTDRAGEWVGGVVVVLGLMMVGIAVRRLRSQAPERRKPDRWDRPWDR
jgi:hypothetical protein